MTVLLVDDEYIVLKGMETMLLYQSELKLDLFTANDAFEGLEMISKVKPDLVIADINMPELDGLSMMEQAKSAGYKGKFIIVSGYEEVDYLKRAIQQQATDYLLKPVDKAKLLSKIHQIHLGQQQQYETVLFKLKMYMLNNRHAQDFTISYEDVCQLLPHKNVCLSILHCPNKPDSFHFRRLLLPYFETVVHFTQGSLTLFLLNTDALLVRESVEKIWRSVFLNTATLVGFSQIQPVSCFWETLLCSEQISLYSEALVDLVRSSLKLQNLMNATVPSALLSPFATILNASQSEPCFEQYFEQLLRHSPHLTEVHEKAFIEITCYNLAIFGLPFDAESLLKNFQIQQQHVLDQRSLHRVLKNILSNFFYYEPSVVSDFSYYSEKIYQVARHIQQNYREDLGLDQVAEIAQLHPSYLSTMFKKETGVTFLQYLHRERMRHACTLLHDNPDMPIETISKTVGYNTPTYFYKIFRTQFGVSPNQWKKQLLVSSE